MSFVEMKKENDKRPDGKPCVLVHGFSESELSIIKKLGLALDIDEMVVIKGSMQNNIIQDIIDGNAAENMLLTPIDEKVVLFNDLSDHDIHEFIGGYKLTGLVRPIYAASTKSSRKWTFKAWIEELMEEREAMRQQQALQEAFKKTNETKNLS